MHSDLLGALEAFAPETDMPLDPGIRHAVLVLRQAGIETFESCEGGEGHSSPEPMVRFHGSAWAGYRAFAAAMENGLPVARLQRVWHAAEQQLTGPTWEIVFYKKVYRD
jgi:hypothetical protein